MNPEIAVELVRAVITLSLILMAPIVGAAVAVGLVVGLLQAVTSIQEQTLSFVPKLAAIGLVTIFTAPWMLRQLMEFTSAFLTRLPEMVR